MSKILGAVIVFSLVITSCVPSWYYKSIRFYNIENGHTIEVYHEDAYAVSGRLNSFRNSDEQFKGEYFIYPPKQPAPEKYSTFGNLDMEQLNSLAEKYGYGKESNAKPAGSLILTGNKGTVIQGVLYKVTPDKKSGDGIGMDNDGGIYRIYMSEERRDKAPK